MRLYPTHGGLVVDAPEGHFEAQDDGGFDLPEPLFTRLHSAHYGGVKAWETQIERQQRALAEEQLRRSDPASMLDVLERLLAAAQGNAVASATQAKAAPAAAKPAAKAPATAAK